MRWPGAATDPRWCLLQSRTGRTPTFTYDQMVRQPPRVARLFRDYLIANPDKIIVWSDFKRAVAAVAPDLASYGQIKIPAWSLLMECANVWAAASDYD